jgi:tetratricopeptide (TPR) repeat protein
MTHYDDDQLADYAFDRDLADDPEALEAHLGECAVCNERLTFLRALDSELKVPETWQRAESFLGSARRVEEIVSVHEQMEEDERCAAAMLEPLLASPLRFRDTDLQSDPKFQTSGAVRVLCRRAHQLHEERPPFSLIVATKAYNLALKLPDARQRRFGAALAQRERANALRYLGRFPEALQALEKAEKLFTDSPGSDPFDVAVVWLIRATVFMETERLTEGRNLARSAAETFRVYGDDFRELSAVMVEGVCLLFAGVAAEAAVAFEHIIEIARSTSDTKMLAYGLENAALSYTAIGDYARALSRDLEAFTLFDQLGIVIERARVNWKLGSLLIARGNLAEGIKSLERSRTELQELGLINDAALATLEWAEARLGVGQPEGVSEACHQIVVVFESGGLLRKARIALAYLHEALRTGSATPALLRHVRLYLEQLPSHPSSSFSPMS